MMKILRKLKISTRLFVGFAIVLVLMCAVGALTLWHVSQLRARVAQQQQDALSGLQLLSNVRTATGTMRGAMLRAALAADPQDSQAALDERERALAKIGNDLADYGKRVTSDADRLHLEHDKAAFDAYVANDGPFVDSVRNGDFATARKLAMAKSLDTYRNAEHALDLHMAFSRDSARRAALQANADFRTDMGLAAVSVVIVTLISIALVSSITGSITRPLVNAIRLANAVANGDLTTDIAAGSNSELGQLLKALRNMNVRLVDIVTQVRSSSEAVALGASQIAAGNEDLSQRTEEQAASLQETAASIEQLTATVKQNVENAQQGNKLAHGTAGTAQRGGDFMNEVVATMGGISDSSKQVEQIISVIESIAFQTNILALNAAVEAARAGNQGRGFAVVASEVRALAQRSAVAAKEIKELVGQSVERVDSGSRQVSDAGTAISDVVREVGYVSALMSEITTASEEQHSGILQINKAIGQIDEVTQHNAALVEQAAAAARNVHEQSQVLQQLVANFRLAA